MEENLPKKRKSRTKKNTDMVDLMNGFTPSKYQQDVFDFIQHGNGNAVIKALAGSGKTSTIVQAVKLIPSTCNALFIAFNKEIVKELEKKLQGVKNVQVKTLHSLGYLMIRRNLGNNIDIDEYKYRTFIKQNIKQLSTTDFNKMTLKLMQQYIDNVTQLCDLGRYNLAQCEKDLLNVVAKHDIPIIDDECEAVIKVLKWGKEHTKSIDFTDMVWLPNELSLNPIGLQYDYIYVDESQDLNYAQRELFLRCFRRGTRFVAVGDPNQCQPAGTKILMYDGTEKNIEDIEIGDKVVTYISKSKCCFKGYKNRTKSGKLLDKYNDVVLNTANRIVNNTVKIKTGNGFISEYSYEHLCYGKFNQETCKNAYALYLMGNDKGMFRIGKTKLFNDNSLKSFGIKARMRSEGCNKGWLLNIYEDDKKAKMAEIYYSTIFGIPQIIFKQQRTGSFFFNDNDIIELYEKLGDITENVKKCLSHFNKLFECPFCVNDNSDKHSRAYSSIYSACNLFPKYMDVIIFDYNNICDRTHGKNNKTDKIIKGLYENIEEIQYLNDKKIVYSLDISNNHNYVADGILTHNCIYSFAGADSESFKKLQELPNTQTLPLPISYRCPKKVVDLANQFVQTMEYREGAPDGEIIHNVSIKDIHDGDMVLCRTKMPLVKLYMRYLRMGVKSYVRGQDIGLNLLRMVDKTEQIVLNVNLQNDGVFTRLYDDLFDERNRLMVKRGMDLSDATLSNQIMSKYDSIKALEILSEGLTSAKELHSRIENVFAESSEGVCLSTIHKAKGLEAENVYILCKTLMPSKLATQDWEKEQEQNLMYVAYTRAKNKLGFVSEKDISPSAGMIDPSAALTELNYIENKICKTLNKNPQVIMDATEVAQYNLKNATVIEKRETNHTEIVSNQNEDDNDTLKKLLELVKKKGGIEKLEKFLEQ